jgi:hypothetical protein
MVKYCCFVAESGNVVIGDDILCSGDIAPLMNDWIWHWEIHLSQCQFVHQKSHMDCPGIEPGPAWRCLKLNVWNVWAGLQVCLVGSEGVTILWCILDVSGLDRRPEDGFLCLNYISRTASCFASNVLANWWSYYHYTIDNQYSRYSCI